MAIYNILSTALTNRDATPKVLSDALLSGGAVKGSYGWVTTKGAADGAGSTYRMCQVPSNCRVRSVDIQTDPLGTGAQVAVGVFYPTFIPVGSGLSASLASTWINTTFFASAFACSNAVSSSNVINSGGSNTIDKQEMPLWEALGLAADPMIDLDIVVEVAAAVAAQGKVGLNVGYIY